MVFGSYGTSPESDIDGRHVHTIRMLASRWGKVILELGRLRSKTAHGCDGEILPTAQQCRCHKGLDARLPRAARPAAEAPVYNGRYIYTARYID
jgi:hypothetical protein